MDVLVGFILGVLAILILEDKPLRIEINHKYPKHNAVEIPDMETVLKDGKVAEDDVYENMGEMLNDINALMTGGETNGKE